MKPIKFKGANKVYTKPMGWTDSECGSLHTHQEGGVVTSLWQPSEVERSMIAAGHAVSLAVHIGTGGLPPMSLAVTKLTAAQIVKESD